jgi:FlaA1/EpsC-like NDP-sugar epimerase
MQQTVLITGGAGSLGRAFVSLLSPEYNVIVVDNNEWAVAELKAEMPQVATYLGDFDTYPLTGFEDIIIHAAAFKHVEIGEAQPSSFVYNNLTKTMRLYEKVQHGITRVLYISTDKAVEPVSVYGATKFIAERLTLEIGGQVARLGNILLSSGSVIPRWEKAITENRPIPITDAAMTRYMITAEDAVREVWEQFLEGRMLCVPEMGEPKRILDIMTEVLGKHGYKKGSDYTPGVELIGMRRGEKLHEKLIWDHERR